MVYPQVPTFVLMRSAYVGKHLAHGPADDSDADTSYESG